MIVTGASKGIGKELAYLLAERGHALYLISRSEQSLAEVVAECRERGAAAVEQLSMNVADPELGKILAGKLNVLGEGLVLVHNAGFAETGAFHELALDSAMRQVGVMMTAPMAVTHALLPALLANNGQVVFVGSIVTKRTFSNCEAYTAAKYGLLGFARVLSESYRRQGLRVTTVTPGSTDTDIWGQQSPPREDMMLPKAVAETILEIVELPEGRVVDEIVVTPPKGIL